MSNDNSFTITVTRQEAGHLTAKVTYADNPEYSGDMYANDNLANLLILVAAHMRQSDEDRVKARMLYKIAGVL